METRKIIVLLFVATLFGGLFGSFATLRLAGVPFLIPHSVKQNNNGQLFQSGELYENSVVRSVQMNTPSVVSIVVSKNLPIITECQAQLFGGIPPELQPFFGSGLNFVEPCTKGFKMQEIGGGSGFIISSDGLIVTNKHVVVDTKAEYTVLLNDGKKYPAKILARDPSKDLAVLKIEASNLPVAKFGDSSTLHLGQTVIAIGNALGEFRNTVSVGVVSGLSRSVKATGLGIVEKIEGVIQTDAAINQGNSGGPLLNLSGEVVGINTAIATDAQNIGFAIPINTLKKSIESVKTTGIIQTPYIGIYYTSIDESIQKAEKLPYAYGALVRGDASTFAVVKGSPADKAGVQVEDIILEINGEKLDKESLISILEKYNVGDEITLKIYRKGKEIETKIRLENRPENL